jgi:hypothetical protein
VELDLSDAIRNHFVIAVDADGSRYRLEPYECDGPGAPVLRGYVVAGPDLGWREFRQWSNLKITRVRFDPKSR